MKIVIADAGPVIHLAEANALHALSVLGEVMIPRAVAEEITAVLGHDG